VKAKASRLDPIGGHRSNQTDPHQTLTRQIQGLLWASENTLGMGALEVRPSPVNVAIYHMVEARQRPPARTGDTRKSAIDSRARPIEPEQGSGREEKTANRCETPQGSYARLSSGQIVPGPARTDQPRPVAIERPPGVCRGAPASLNSCQNGEPQFSCACCLRHTVDTTAEPETGLMGGGWKSSIPSVFAPSPHNYFDFAFFRIRKASAMDRGRRRHDARVTTRPKS